MEKTIGEQRVRTEFNPSQNDKVSQIKQKSAELINLCEDLLTEKADENGKIKHDTMILILKAQSTYEEAAMWAVKAATA